MARYFVAFIFSILTSQAFAADYYWTKHWSDPTPYPSALAACSAKNFTNADGVTFTATSVDMITSTYADCISERCPLSGSCSVGKYTGGVNRYGNSCPVNTEYNATTGGCDSIVDPCLPTVDQIVSHRHNYGPINGAVVDPPSVVCDNSCQYSNTWDHQCYRNFSEDKDAGYCNFKYKGNGVSCTTGNPQPGSVFDQPPTKPPIPFDPTYTETNNCDSWTTNADGSRTRNCTANAEYKDPGRLDCQNGSGTLVCAPGSPSPKYSGQDTDIQTDETPRPDGSKNTTTTTTTTTTTCKGADPCVTTTKTETQGAETNPDGTPGDETSDCVGTGCNPGDANQDGKPDDEEEEEEERLAAIGACDMPATCSGDAIDCAVLQEEKTQRCLAEDNSDYLKHKDEVEGQLGADKYQLDSETVNVPSLLDGSTRFLPSSCPQPTTVSLNSGQSLSFDYSPFCSFASGLAPVVVALALLFGAIYVGRAFGG